MTIVPDSPAGSYRELVLTRLIDAPHDKLYRAWTEPELLKQWFAPLPYTTPRAELDVRPGGASLVVMRAPDGNEIPCRGVYLEVVPNERIVFTDAYTEAWVPSEKPFMTVVLDVHRRRRPIPLHSAREPLDGCRSRGAREDGLSCRLGTMLRPARRSRREALSCLLRHHDMNGNWVAGPWHLYPHGEILSADKSLFRVVANENTVTDRGDRYRAGYRPSCQSYGCLESQQYPAKAIITHFNLAHRTYKPAGAGCRGEIEKRKVAGAFRGPV